MSIVKIVFPGNDIRRFAIPEAGVFAHLVNVARANFAKPDAQIRLSYLDDEGDNCQVTSEEEIKEALRLSSVASTVPKFFLTLDGGDAISEDDGVLISETASEPVSVSFSEAKEVSLDLKASQPVPQVKFVQDIALQDGTIVARCLPFCKTWRVMNSGSTEWPAGSRLSLVAASSSPSIINVIEEPIPALAPGLETNVSVTFELEEKSHFGSHKACFVFKTADSNDFQGDALRLDVEVEAKLDAVLVSSDADALIAPGEQVTKSLLIRNTGEAPFPPSTLLIFQEGNLEPCSTAAVPCAAVGEDVKVSVTFVTPIAEGPARGQWSLATSSEFPVSFFGQPLVINAQVKEPLPSIASVQTFLQALKVAAPSINVWEDKEAVRAANFVSQWLNAVTPEMIFAGLSPSTAEGKEQQQERATPADADADADATPADGKKEHSEPQLHLGVKCDGCDIDPIPGTRFKCTVCPDFDLCGSCEAKGLHPREHTMIKYREPMQRPCGGFWRRGGGRGRGRGGCGRGGRSAHAEAATTPQPSFLQHIIKGLFGGVAVGSVAEPSHATTASASASGSCAEKQPGFNWRERASAAVSSTTATKHKMSFVKDVTLDDGTVVAPGVVVSKKWTVKNPSTAAWPADTILEYVGGELKPVSGAAPPTLVCDAGNEVDVSVDIKTPESAGRYTGYYRPSTGEGRRFGDRLWVDLLVTSADGSVPADQHVRNLAKEAKAAEKALKAETDAHRKEAKQKLKDAAKESKAADKEAAKQAKKLAKAASQEEADANANAEAKRKACEEHELAKRLKEAEEEEACKRKSAEEAKRRSDEADAEAKRKADEAEAKRKADEAEAKRKANEAEAKRKADEAEAKRKADEAEAKRKADEAEANRKADEEAQMKAALDEAKRAAEVEAERKAAQEAKRKAAEEEASLPSFLGKFAKQLEILYKMGFTDIVKCTDELAKANGDVGRVVNWLLQ